MILLYNVDRGPAYASAQLACPYTQAASDFVFATKLPSLSCAIGAFACASPPPPVRPAPRHCISLLRVIFRCRLIARRCLTVPSRSVVHRPHGSFTLSEVFCIKTARSAPCLCVSSAISERSHLSSLHVDRCAIGEILGRAKPPARQLWKVRHVEMGQVNMRVRQPVPAAGGRAGGGRARGRARRAGAGRSAYERTRTLRARKSRPTAAVIRSIVQCSLSRSVCRQLSGGGGGVRLRMRRPGCRSGAPSDTQRRTSRRRSGGSAGSARIRRGERR